MVGTPTGAPFASGAVTAGLPFDGVRRSLARKLALAGHVDGRPRRAAATGSTGLASTWAATAESSARPTSGARKPRAPSASARSSATVSSGSASSTMAADGRDRTQATDRLDRTGRSEVRVQQHDRRRHPPREAQQLVDRRRRSDRTERGHADGGHDEPLSNDRRAVTDHDSRHVVSPLGPRAGHLESYRPSDHAEVSRRGEPHPLRAGLRPPVRHLGGMSPPRRRRSHPSTLARRRRRAPRAAAR